MKLRLLALLALAGLGCPPASTLPTGCGKDVDCKGSRICVAHACIEPVRGDGGVSDAGAGLTAAADGSVFSGAAEVNAAPPTQPALGVSAGFHVDAQHTGRSPYRAPTTAPKEVMHVATGGVVYGAPAIADDGTIVFGSHDRSIYGAQADGTIRWRKPTGDLVWCSPSLGLGGAVAYVGSDDDRLYALDLKDGAVRWQFQAGPCRSQIGIGPESARCDVDGVNVGADGTVYLAADGLYALRPDGTLRWKFAPGATHCATSPAIGVDGTVFVGCQDDALYAVDGASGQKKWEYRTQDDVDSSPAVGADGTVYFGSDDRKLYAVAPGGSLRFAVATGGAVRSSPALGADGTVYVGSFDGSLYAVKPSGAVAFTFRTADRVLSSPLVDAAGTILIGSEDDRLYALAPDGKLLWSLLMDGDVDGTPALAADGTIYIGTDDRALHALR